MVKEVKRKKFARRHTPSTTISYSNVTQSSSSQAHKHAPVSTVPYSTTKSSPHRQKSRRSQTSASSRLDWQNPLIAYWTTKYPKRKLKRRRPSQRARVEFRILAMLACFSISVGLWENFRQLWLQKNGFSTTDVSNIISLGTIVSVIGIIIVAKTINIYRIKRLMFISLLARSVNMLMLFVLNGSGLGFLIDLSILLDITTTALVLTGVYPLITTVRKNNDAYSRRKLVEYLFRDVGIFIGGIFVSQSIGGFMISYNICLLIALFFSIAAAIIILRIHIVITESAPTSRFSVTEYIFRDKIQRLYMIFSFLTKVAWSTALGLKMLMLTNYFDFSASMATTYLLILGLLSDVLGMLALRYFTPKNDYITILIKYGVRIIIFAFALATSNIFVCFLAMTWGLLSYTAYENITDGYYVNAIDNRYQLQFNSLKHVVNYLGDAVGIFLCGQTLQFGAQYSFGLSALLFIPVISLSFYMIYLRHTKKRAKRHSNRFR